MFHFWTAAKMSILLLLLLLIISRVNSTDNEVKLLDSIMKTKDYNKLVRPVRQERTLNITFRINLCQLVEVNEPSQNIILYVYVIQKWEDEYLGWNPERFGGLNTTVLPHSQVWIPDTYMYNSVSMDPSEKLYNIHISTESNDDRASYVKLDYPAVYTLSCHLDVTYFPFDRQTCTMIFGSWTYDSTQIAYWIETKTIFMEGFVENEEWTVLDFSFRRELVYFKCCINPFVMIKANLVIERKPLFYLINLVAPTLMITTVAVVGFFIPGSTGDERADKVELGMTTLLAMAIILLMVVNSIPKTSVCVPLLGFFYISIMVLISFGTILTSVGVLVERRGRRGKFVSKYTKRIFFSCIATILFMRPPLRLEEFWRRKAGGRKVQSPTKVRLRTHSQQSNLLDGSADLTASITFGSRDELYVISRSEAALLEWQYLAEILDRICLIIFLVVIFSVTIVLLSIGYGVMHSDRFL